MLKSDLSLAIVTYNNAKIIEKSVRSIIENIPTTITYILYIVDNNSLDNTLEVVKKIEGNIKIIKLTNNNGFGSGHNKVLDLLNSKYHLVVNPDIVIESAEQIKKMFDYMENNLEVGMLSPLIVNPDLSTQYLCKYNPTVIDMLIRRISPKIFKKRQAWYVMKHTGYDKIMNLEYASGCFMFFRTSLFIELRGFDENFFMYLEDADITRRVNQISKTIFFPEARVIHAWERGSYKNMKLAYITIQSMLIYFKKWGFRFK
ncbi:glycosyltransferase family 2 protein [Paenibacillus sp. NPDC056579]|uniref:glycosyltransferase family 2 protein n=1 Tax=Paenibacillus sp. NPDC056579 TaxID=3345871 RepID=UPI0036CDAE40